MSAPAYRRSRFDTDDGDPMGPLANLADIMLVLAVGLMVALAAARGGFEQMRGGIEVEAARELPERPPGASQAGGTGMQSVGRVYRDPETGRLVWISEEGDQQ